MQRKMKGKLERIEELKGRRVNEEVHNRFMEELNFLIEKYQM